MAFVSLFLLWPLILLMGLLSLLNLALPVIYWAMLIWNVLILAALLLIRHFWRKTGTMDRSFLDALGGWKRVLLLVLKYGLLVFIIWEIILVLACAVLVIWAPALFTFPP